MLRGSFAICCCCADLCRIEGVDTVMTRISSFQWCLHSTSNALTVAFLLMNVGLLYTLLKLEKAVLLSVNGAGNKESTETVASQTTSYDTAMQS